MPIFNAKCPNCSANLQVDKANEAAICQYCGSAFVVEKAINNYNTYVTQELNNAKVNITVESEYEHLIKSGEYYYNNKQYSKALDTYIEICDKFPYKDESNFIKRDEIQLIVNQIKQDEQEEAERKRIQAEKERAAENLKIYIDKLKIDEIEQESRERFGIELQKSRDSRLYHANYEFAEKTIEEIKDISKLEKNPNNDSIYLIKKGFFTDDEEIKEDYYYKMKRIKEALYTLHGSCGELEEQLIFKFNCAAKNIKNHNEEVRRRSRPFDILWLVGMVAAIVFIIYAIFG